MPKKLVKVAAIQTKVFVDMDANLKNAVTKVKQAAQRGAKIICLPELYRTIYFPQKITKNFEKYTETIPGESTAVFSRLAEELKVVIIVPLFEKAKDGCFYNSAVVINDEGKLLPTYRKIHIPHDPLFYEQSYFKPSDFGYKIYKTKYATFAVLICYDQWFPEAARLAALAGAEIITRWAPAFKCLADSARLRNTPVDSITTATPNSAQGRPAGSVWLNSFNSRPSITTSVT